MIRSTFMAVLAVFTLSLGAMIRNSAGAIATYAGIIFVLPGLVGVLSNSLKISCIHGSLRGVLRLRGGAAGGRGGVARQARRLNGDARAFPGPPLTTGDRQRGRAAGHAEL
jgi:hypothetical protein